MVDTRTRGSFKEVIFSNISNQRSDPRYGLGSPRKTSLHPHHRNRPCTLCKESDGNLKCPQPYFFLCRNSNEVGPPVVPHISTPPYYVGFDRPILLQQDPHDLYSLNKQGREDEHWLVCTAGRHWLCCRCQYTACILVSRLRVVGMWRR